MLFAAVVTGTVRDNPYRTNTLANMLLCKSR